MGWVAQDSVASTALVTGSFSTVCRCCVAGAARNPWSPSRPATCTAANRLPIQATEGPSTRATNGRQSRSSPCCVCSTTGLAPLVGGTTTTLTTASAVWGPRAGGSAARARARGAGWAAPRTATSWSPCMCGTHTSPRAAGARHPPHKGPRADSFVSSRLHGRGVRSTRRSCAQTPACRAATCCLTLPPPPAHGFFYFFPS